MTGPPPLSEREFTGQVRELAAVLGWHRYHTWLSKHSTAGFPDEVLCRPPRIVFAELKGDIGQVSPAQADWLDLLDACGVETCLWRPSMIDEIAGYLRPTLRPAGPGPGAWSPQDRPGPPSGQPQPRAGTDYPVGRGCP